MIRHRKAVSDYELLTDQLRDLYERRNVELSIFGEVTSPAHIDASVYRIKAIDEQIRAMRAMLSVA